MGKIALIVEDNGNLTVGCKRLLAHLVEEVGLGEKDIVVTKVSSKTMRYGKPASLYTVYKKDFRKPNPQLEQDFQYIKNWVHQQQPSVIIPCGDVAIDAILGQVGVGKLRGSQYLINIMGVDYPVVPTYAPAMVLKRWDWRPIMKADIQRAIRLAKKGYKYPDYNFIISPSYEEAYSILNSFLNRAKKGEELVLSCDIETISKQIACVGWGWSKTEAICIPLITSSNFEGFYSLEEEVNLTYLMRDILTHPNITIVGQNFSFDSQYFCRYWGCLPTKVWDTMTAHHTCFPGLPKTLDFLSSLYCEFHQYWKDELKDYRKYPADETKFWTYNCKDCVVTWELYYELKRIVNELNLTEQNQFQQDLFYPVMRMMLRGVRLDLKLKDKISIELMEAIREREELLNFMVGHSLNPNSPKQMKEFFYEELGMKMQKVKTPEGMRPSTNSDSLQKLARIEPLIKPIVTTIEEIRSLKIFLSNFALAGVDSDGHIRCSYNISGTETFRFSSSKNVFGTGANLQTIPKGTED